VERLIILLTESSLETIPKDLLNDPVIIRDAKRMRREPRYLILDRARHHSAMAKLRDAERRGRPDIVHEALLTIQDSPLARSGLVKTYIHTINNVVIDVDPEIRPPRNYNNFIGLMSQLFKLGRVPPTGKPLLRIVSNDVKYVLNTEKPDRVVLLDDVRGRETTMMDLVNYLVSLRKPLVMIGGFPRGSFSEATYSLANDVVKVGKYVMSTSSILCRLLHALEMRLGIFT
jgi:rRNA small subunit pseudouridine methyltransferase Nep1